MPLLLVVANVMIFVILQRLGAVAKIPTFIVVAVLAANFGFTWWTIGYCSVCGRTISRGQGRCPSCAQANKV